MAGRSAFSFEGGLRDLARSFGGPGNGDAAQMARLQYDHERWKRQDARSQAAHDRAQQLHGVNVINAEALSQMNQQRLLDMQAEVAERPDDFAAENERQRRLGQQAANAGSQDTIDRRNARVGANYYQQEANSAVSGFQATSAENRNRVAAAERVPIDRAGKGLWEIIGSNSGEARVDRLLTDPVAQTYAARLINGSPELKNALLEASGGGDGREIVGFALGPDNTVTLMVKNSRGGSVSVGPETEDASSGNGSNVISMPLDVFGSQLNSLMQAGGYGAYSASQLDAMKDQHDFAMDSRVPRQAQSVVDAAAQTLPQLGAGMAPIQERIGQAGESVGVLEQELKKYREQNPEFFNEKGELIDRPPMTTQQLLQTPMRLDGNNPRSIQSKWDEVNKGYQDRVASRDYVENYRDGNVHEQNLLGDKINQVTRARDDAQALHDHTSRQAARTVRLGQGHKGATDTSFAGGLDYARPEMPKLENMRPQMKDGLSLAASTLNASSGFKGDNKPSDKAVQGAVFGFLGDSTGQAFASDIGLPPDFTRWGDDEWATFNNHAAGRLRVAKSEDGRLAINVGMLR